MPCRQVSAYHIDRSHQMGGDRSHHMGGDRSHQMGGDRSHHMGGDRSHHMGRDSTFNPQTLRRLAIVTSLSIDKISRSQKFSEPSNDKIKD